MRENAGNQVVTGVSFASDWLRQWREFTGPITVRSNAGHTFDVQLETVIFIVTTHVLFLCYRFDLPQK